MLTSLKLIFSDHYYWRVATRVPIDKFFSKMPTFHRKNALRRLNRKSFTDKTIRKTKTRSERTKNRGEIELYDAKHALNGNARARGKIRIHGDFMNVVAQRKIELPKCVLFHISANGFRAGWNYGLAGRGFG